MGRIYATLQPKNSVQLIQNIFFLKKSPKAPDFKETISEVAIFRK
jgi:hypothetical protein